MPRADTPRVLVTGATGRLGGSLWRGLDLPIEPWGTGRRPAPHCGRYVPCDLAVAASVDRIFEDVQPDCCIHCAAISDPDDCERRPELCHLINVAATENICSAARRFSVRLIVASTDYVFGNRQAVYREDDPPSPLQAYGRSKVLAEHAAMQQAGTIVLRLSLLYGSAEACFVRQVQHALREGRDLALDDTTLRYPLFIPNVVDVARALVLSPSITGVLHASGPQAITKFGWAKMIARLCGCDPSRLHPLTRGCTGAGAVRPGSIRLDDGRLRALLSFAPDPVEPGTRAVLNANGGKGKS